MGYGSPLFFAPLDPQLMEQKARSPLGITGRTTIWDVYIGFNISHSIGLTVFGLFLILIGKYDFRLVTKERWVLRIAILVPLGYLLTALIFWFFAPAIASGMAAVCFLYCHLGLRKYRLEIG